MKEITANELKKLQDNGEKVLVQYTASWCGPCRSLSPKLELISNTYSDVKFSKIDVDNLENQDLIINLGIMSVPTVIIYNGHKVVDRSKGLHPDNYYKDVLNNL